MKNLITALLLISTLSAQAQNVMTAEKLLALKKVSAIGLSSEEILYYNLYTPDVSKNQNNKSIISLEIKNDRLKEKILTKDKDHRIEQILPDGNLLMVKGKSLVLCDQTGFPKKTLMNNIENRSNFKLSPDSKKLAFTQEIQYNLVKSDQIYDDLPESEVYIYDDLNYRHWDTWNDGKVSHLFWGTVEGSNVKNIQDVMKGEEFDCPQKPFGGAEDYTWDQEGKVLLYVCKKESGLKYAQSTNTDIYAYNTNTLRSYNISEGMMGYDMAPAFNDKGSKLAWLSMKRDGYESDKNDIVVYDMMNNSKSNITADWDGTVHSFLWSTDDENIYFLAPTQGTEQVFVVNINTKKVSQITEGPHNITGILGLRGTNIILSKQNMNQATELYAYSLSSKSFSPLTYANTEAYAGLELSKIEKRMVPTVDGKSMLVWVIYPPNFDENKKYPTLLYCQGGPQAQVSQFYSFRWNFQLMAANGYIVIAPNRRGLPGFGVKWNEAISQDWGGMAMKDYMQATDVLSEEIPAIDAERIAAVGASYGGYSVYMLAGIHQNRYKTFIAHCGLFDLKSWYGTTEELWFADWDLGGPYYRNTPASYDKFSPSDFVKNWNKPMLIFQGGKDYRVPIGQGLQAFQAARVNKLKSRLVYLPNENHWVLQSQNALAWQREFYRWLKETL